MPSSDRLDPRQLQLCALVLRLACKAGGGNEDSTETKIFRELASKVWLSISEAQKPGAQAIARRIRKLRWLGLDDDARRLEATLSKVPEGECVLLLPINTD
jgi:hypothetical protein